jgi:malate dehydrogenase (quinone)
MLSLIEKCFPDRMAGWEAELKRMVPSYGIALAEDPALAESTIARTAETLKIHA